MSKKHWTYQSIVKNLSALKNLCINNNMSERAVAEKLDVAGRGQTYDHCQEIIDIGASVSGTPQPNRG